MKGILGLMDGTLAVDSEIGKGSTFNSDGCADAKTVPIIAVSADAIQNEVEKAMTSGFTEYLTKPIEPQKLYQILEKYKTTI